MIKVFVKLLNSLKRKPDIWFFYAFLATSTLSIRKVLFCYPINNSFNEYTGIYLYLSDVFLFLTLVVWILTLCNKKYILSIYNSFIIFFKQTVPRLPRKLFHACPVNCSTWNNCTGVKQFYCLKIAYQQVIHNFVFIFPLFLAIFSFLSILWAKNPQIALFRSIKLFEFVLLFFYIYKLFHVEQFTQNKLIIKRVFQIIIGVSMIQSIIGICQFLIQHSIGLLWLKESILSQNIPGVAKMIFNSHIYIRAYGLFPHPNILGGFLAFSILISILYLKLFHVEQFTSPTQYLKALIKNIQNFKIVPRGTIILIIVILVQGLALLLTFSKSAIIGLFIGLLYLYIKIVPRGTILNTLKSRNFYKKAFLFFSIIVLSFFILNPNKYSLFFKSLQERAFYLNVSRGTFLSHPLIGLGSGQFVINMENIKDIQSWQYQPVHNVFLLVLNDFGIFIFLLFSYFIYKLFHLSTNVPPQYKCSTWNILRGSRGTFYETSMEQSSIRNIIFIYFKAIIIIFIFIMLFDHYLWDIQQGQIILWLLFGFIAGCNRTISLT